MAQYGGACSTTPLQLKETPRHGPGPIGSSSAQLAPQHPDPDSSSAGPTLDCTTTLRPGPVCALVPGASSPHVAAQQHVPKAPPAAACPPGSAGHPSPGPAPALSHAAAAWTRPCPPRRRTWSSAAGGQEPRRAGGKQFGAWPGRSGGCTACRNWRHARVNSPALCPLRGPRTCPCPPCLFLCLLLSICSVRSPSSSTQASGSAASRIHSGETGRLANTAAALLEGNRVKLPSPARKL